jgi:tripartite ATP-independent transporter DctP family solute receptor
MIRLYSWLAVLAIAFLGGPAGAEVKLRAANIHAPTQPYTLALKRWGEMLGEQSGGEIEVAVFDSGTVVSNQQDSYSQVKLGTVDVTLASLVKDDVPALQIATFPYAFTSYETWRAFMDGDFVQGLTDEFRERTGIRILGIQYLGARHLTANKPIKHPDDLAGMKIRAVELPIFLETVRGLGALATPVAFQEVLPALKTGVIDGQENPIPTIYQMNFYEAQSHIMLTGHLHGGDFWMMNEARFQSLTPAQQELVQTLAAEAIAWGERLILEQEQQLIAELEAKGVTFIGPEDGLDVEAFVERVRAEAWPNLADEIGQDVLDKVVAMEVK